MIEATAETLIQGGDCGPLEFLQVKDRTIRERGLEGSVCTAMNKDPIRIDDSSGKIPPWNWY